MPRRIVPGVPGDFVLDPVPLLSLTPAPPESPRVTHTLSSPPPQTPRAQGKVSGLPEKVFSPESSERPGWLSPPRSAQPPSLPPLPALPSAGSGPDSSPLPRESTNAAAAELPEPSW